MVGELISGVARSAIKRRWSGKRGSKGWFEVMKDDTVVAIKRMETMVVILARA